MASTLDSLPNELQQNIFGLCDASALRSLRQVNSVINANANFVLLPRIKVIKIDYYDEFQLSHVENFLQKSLMPNLREFDLVKEKDEPLNYPAVDVVIEFLRRHRNTLKWIYILLGREKDDARVGWTGPNGPVPFLNLLREMNLHYLNLRHIHSGKYRSLATPHRFRTSERYVEWLDSKIRSFEKRSR